MMEYCAAFNVFGGAVHVVPIGKLMVNKSEIKAMCGRSMEETKMVLADDAAPHRQMCGTCLAVYAGESCPSHEWHERLEHLR